MSQPNASFFQQVYDLVQTVPAGKVTTYGAVAKALGTPDARRVGRALHANPDASKTSCHRVVFSTGKLARGYAFGGPNEQMRKLQSEGITFDSQGVIDLKQVMFYPDKL